MAISFQQSSPATKAVLMKMAIMTAIGLPMSVKLLSLTNESFKFKIVTCRALTIIYTSCIQFVLEYAELVYACAAVINNSTHVSKAVVGA